MAIEPRKAALLVIDMQNGFISEDSPLCIAGAEATLAPLARVIEHAREIGMPVYYVRREYAEDGSDVEAVRYRTWFKGGRPLSPDSDQPGSLDFPDIIAPKAGDKGITKPRFSAFFGTKLDEELHLRTVNTIVLTGTTTPNCVRTTCYDGLSLDYNVVVIEDCTSSRTPEVQKANIDDMAYIGAQIMDSETFCREGLESVRDIQDEYKQDMAANQAFSSIASMFDSATLPDLKL